MLNHRFPHPAILLHSIGAGDFEIDLSDQKKKDGQAGGTKVDFSGTSRRNEAQIMILLQ